VNTEPMTGAQLPRVQTLQGFLSESDWDESQVQAQRLTLLREDPTTIPTAQGVLVIDETGVSLDGHKTAHVTRQYLGNRGKIDNGVVSVTSLWADEHVYYPLEIEPYTPERYFVKGKNDPAFRTKLKIALQLVQQALQEGWPFRAMVADSFYGEDRGLRGELRKLKVPYVMPLKPSHTWWHPKNVAGSLQEVAREAGWVRCDQPGQWVHIIKTFQESSSQDWWALEIVAGPYGRDKVERAVATTTAPQALPDATTWYLITNLPAPTELPPTEQQCAPASLEEVLRLYGLRMWVEQSDKQIKQALGWSQYQVRSDRAIRRHWQLVCCAFSFCWYHASRPAGSTAEELERTEPEILLVTPVPALGVGTGKKNQRGNTSTTTGVLPGQSLCEGYEDGWSRGSCSGGIGERGQNSPRLLSSTVCLNSLGGDRDSSSTARSDALSVLC
jgi:SRSO17 transposase